MEGINFSFFSGLILENVSLKDPNGNLVASMDEFHFDVKWRKLFRRKVQIEHIILNKPIIHLIANDKGETNLQFLIDIFPKANFNLQFPDILVELKSLQINEGEFWFDNVDKKHIEGFDPAHFKISDLNTHIAIDYATKDSLQAELIHLSAKESNGLKINDINFNFGIGKNKTYIKPFTLKLPNSSVLVEELSLSYDSLQQVFDKELLQKRVKITFNLNKAEIVGKDLKALVPGLKNFNEPLKAKGKVSFYNNNIKLNGFKAEYSKNTIVKLNAEINGINNAEDTYIFTNIQQISSKTQDIEKLISDITLKPFILPNEVKNLGQFNFSGNIVGFFSDIVAFGTLKTDAGKINTDLKISYIIKNNDWKFNGKIATEDVNLSRILNKSTDFDDIHLDVIFDGQKLANAPLSGHVHGVVSSFDYKQYEFDNIILDSRFSEENINAEIKYKDPSNGNIDFIVDIEKSKDATYTMNLNGKVDTVCLAAMKLMDVFPTFKFSTNVQSQLKLKTLNDVEGYFALDSISLYNENIKMNPENIILFAENTEDGKRIIL